MLLHTTHFTRVFVRNSVGTDLPLCDFWLDTDKVKVEVGQGALGVVPDLDVNFSQLVRIIPAVI